MSVDRLAVAMLVVVVLGVVGAPGARADAGATLASVYGCCK